VTLVVVVLPPAFDQWRGVLHQFVLAYCQRAGLAAERGGDPHAVRIWLTLPGGALQLQSLQA
jgi:hypothetical protein